MFDSEIRLEGVANFRDIGGYRTADGRKVRCRQIFRSGGLNNLTNNDFNTLSSLGLRLVCDLRSEHERSNEPTVWPKGFAPDTLHLNVNADLRAGNDEIIKELLKDPSGRGAVTVMMNVYQQVPDMLKVYLGTIFSTLSAGNQVPLIFHCSAGKDRTGILSAITLLALGVPRDTVYEDYLKTRRYLKPLELRISKFLQPIFAPKAPPQEVVMAFVDVRESYLDEAMAALGEKQGCIDDYLRSAGITGEQINLLRNSMLE